MPECLVIERLEFLGRCGVTPEERQSPQPIAVDLELDYLPHAFRAVAESGDLCRAVDYASISDRVIAIGTERDYVLVETLAERLTDTLLAEYGLSRVRLWVRKLSPPLKLVSGSVGVRVDRVGYRNPGGTQPARFLAEQVQLLPKGTVLDVAAGRGRNSLFLATLGYTVEATDSDQVALSALTSEAERLDLANVKVRCIDLEARPEIRAGHYDAMVVFFFLFRPLVPILVNALKPGGVLIYETFLIDNHLRHHHPRRREFCLAHNELLHLATGLRVLHYDEGERSGGHGEQSAFTARLVAQKETV